MRALAVLVAAVSITACHAEAAPSSRDDHADVDYWNGCLWACPVADGHLSSDPVATGAFATLRIHNYPSIAPFAVSSGDTTVLAPLFVRTIVLAAWLIVACDAPAESLDAGTDAGPAPSCAHLQVQVAGTPETDLLAGAPERCGQPAHVWSRDPSLGSIVASRQLTRFSAASLESLLESQAVVVPEPLRYDASMRMITYVTQDRGDLVEATALVASPQGLPSGAPDPDVVLFLHGSSGYADGCGPTRDPGSQLLAALLASLGWIVVAPDYLGLRGDGEPTGFPHPYLVGQPTAIASLDAARAVLAMDPATRGGLCTSGLSSCSVDLRAGTRPCGSTGSLRTTHRSSRSWARSRR